MRFHGWRLDVETCQCSSVQMEGRSPARAIVCPYALSANAEIPDSASATVEESKALRVFGPPPALMAPHCLRSQVPVWSRWDFAQLDKGDIAAAENWEQRLDALIRQADTVFLFRTGALAGR